MGPSACVLLAFFGVAALLHVATASGPLRDCTLGLTEVDWHPERSKVYLGSPSLLHVNASVVLATADRFGSGFAGQPRNASLYRSVDGGQSWSFVCWIQGQYWSNLFTLAPGAADVYFLGTSSDGASPIKISRSRDFGATWEPQDSAVLFHGTPGRFAESGFETGPTPSLVAGGRVWRAMELFPAPSRWPVDYQAVMISAPVNASLLDPASWTITEPLPFDTAWLPKDWQPCEAPGYLEGNAVEGPDGEILDVLRVNSKPNLGNYAVILQHMEETNELQFKALVNLPGGHTKFVIHRDPVTKLYITLSNNNTDAAYQDQRNILVLCTSPDLYNWTIVGRLLWDDTGFLPQDSVRYTGFHYVDWHFDGDDLTYLVRTGYRGAVSYHNSNRITFKRLQNFRSFLPGGETMATVAVAGSGFEDRPLHNGAVAYLNRDYVWMEVPQFFGSGVNFTSLNGGVTNTTISLTASAAGYVFVANDGPAHLALQAVGFELMDPNLAGLMYTDSHETRLQIYRMAVEPGTQLTLPQAGWSGCILIHS